MYLPSTDVEQHPLARTCIHAKDCGATLPEEFQKRINHPNAFRSRVGRAVDLCVLLPQRTVLRMFLWVLLQ